MNRTKIHLIGFSVLMLTEFFIFCLPQNAYAQEEPCSKPKVAVVMQVEEVKEGEFFKHLNDQYPSQPKGSWLNQIQEKVLEELRMNSPGTQFIRATGDVPKDCDYYFKYIFSLIGAGQDIEVAGLLHSEYTAYWMSSTLAQNSACGNQNYILNVEITRDNRDINKTIERNISAHGNIGNRIKEREESHAVPPRGPEMIASQDREYVSPLEEEKELKIKIDVSNCKGEPVYDRYHGQWVYLPRYTERGEIRPTKGFPQELLVTDNQVILIIVRPVGASATYSLKKGIKASQDPAEIKTCGLDREAVNETKIQIHGLELRVKPKKKSVSPGENTDIIISFNEVDTKNKKYPVPGKELEIKVTGIVDGNISSKGNYITDEHGDVVLTYKAGDNDKRIKITAKYQPKDYPEFVQDESTITVAHYESQATVTMTEKGKFTTEDGVETTSATLNVVLKFTHTEVDDDLEFVECYDLVSWNVNNAFATITVKDKQGTHNYETHKVKKEELEDEEKTDQLLIFFDKNGKAKSIEPPNLMYWFIFDDFNGMRLDPPVDPNNYVDVKDGDGINKILGGGTGVVGGLEYTVKWEIKRYRKKQVE